jgi:outer membrane protein TolC
MSKGGSNLSDRSLHCYLRAPLMKSAFATLAFLVVFSGIGCVQYAPKPLESSDHARLTDADRERIQVAASELHHPILKPVQLDLSRGVSPDEIAVLAVLMNPDLRAERDRRAISQAQLLQAGLLPNLQLTGNLDFPYDASAPDNHVAYGLGLTWDINALITRNARQTVAAEDAKSVELEIAWKEWQTAQSAKTSAYNVLALEEGLRIAREIREQLEENLRIVQKAVDNHQKTLLDLSAAESASRDTVEAEVAQERELRRERLQLNQSLGLSPDADLKLRDVELPSHFASPPVRELLDNLDNRRLDLVALRHGYQSQEATVRAAVLGQFPKISAGPELARDTTAIKTIGIGLTVDLPIFDRNQAAIALEQATRQKLFDEYSSRRIAARSEIELAALEIDSINKQIAAAEASIASLQRLTQAYEKALQQGNTDIVSYYTARGDLARKQIDLTKLKQELVQQWIALELASGQFLPLNAPSATTAPSDDGKVR